MAMMSAKKKSILVVDDDLDLMELVQRDLIEQGYRVLTAPNGQAALSVIEAQGVPHLILLDMFMPVMDGWTFAKDFTDRYGRSCPVVVMTAMDDSITRAMEIGADAYLGKPFDLDTLNSTVDSMLAV